MRELRPVNMEPQAILFAGYIEGLRPSSKNLLQQLAGGKSYGELSRDLSIPEVRIKSDLTKIAARNPIPFPNVHIALISLIRHGVSSGVLNFKPSEKPLIPLNSADEGLCRLLLEGKLAADIAAQFSVSSGVIHKYVSNVLEKMQVKTVYELAAAYGYRDSLKKM